MNRGDSVGELGDVAYVLAKKSGELMIDAEVQGNCLYALRKLVLL